tara:strand:- start:255 stop:653 length:399 start_codon:yes stop_codon:yes gene_type:complete
VVANLCVYASTSETHPIVLVQPAEPALVNLAKSLGIEGHGLGDLVYEESIQREVLLQMQAIGRRSGLTGIEIVVGVVLADEEWTPQNVRICCNFGAELTVQNLVTATLKLNRKALFDKYQKEIGAAYSKSKN